MWRSTCGLALALFITTTASVALAQDDTARAHEEFQHGVELFQNGDYQRALDAFQEAYRLAPHAAVRLNIANCYQQLNRPVEALFHFEHYLSEADHPSPAQRREIEATIRELRQRIGTITFQVTPDGATITIDGADQRRAPVTEPVRVTQGRHSIEIRLDGYRTETQTVDVAGGGDARVAVRLARAEAVATTTPPATTVAPATTTTTEPTTPVATTTPEPIPPTTTTSTPTPTPTPEPERPSHPSSGGGLQITWPTILAASVTGAALIVALITGPLALQANDRFNNDVMLAHGSDPTVAANAVSDGNSQASTARTLAAVTDVMIVTSVLGAAATVTLFILDQTNAPSSGESVAVVPVITPFGGAVMATGHF
jgi:hypothetical protein